MITVHFRYDDVNRGALEKKMQGNGARKRRAVDPFRAGGAKKKRSNRHLCDSDCKNKHDEL